jgi:hypothetical protein
MFDGAASREKKAHPDEGVVSRIAHAAPDGGPDTGNGECRQA